MHFSILSKFNLLFFSILFDTPPKIDRGFIHELTVGSKDEMILESIVHLAIRLGLVVTAEGVESPLQMEILSRLGCQQLQGYLLGMPMDVKRLEEFEYTSSTYFN